MPRSPDGGGTIDAERRHRRGESGWAPGAGSARSTGRGRAPPLPSGLSGPDRPGGFIRSLLIGTGEAGPVGPADRGGKGTDDAEPTDERRGTSHDESLDPPI